MRYNTIHLFRVEQIREVFPARDNQGNQPQVLVEFYPHHKKNSVEIRAEVSCLGRTGVEMEALTAVTVAALTIYDMMKWKDRGMVISDVKLLYKTGGKSGEYCVI